jgi:hypothetical protein
MLRLAGCAKLAATAISAGCETKSTARETEARAMNRPQRRRPIFHPATGSRVAVFHGSPLRRRPGAQERVPKLDSLSDVNAALAALPDALALDSSPDGLLDTSSASWPASMSIG